MKIINIPIEPIEWRYSTQWQNWFLNYFYSQNIRYRDVLGPVTSGHISQGSFLDVVETNYFKTGQLNLICKMIMDGDIDNTDVFFFHDLWFPGIELLAYIRDGAGLNFKICGCLHAGSYDESDFLHKKGMTSWAEPLENSWFNFIDKIFVATNYHKNLLMKKREVEPHRIKVTGFPIYNDFGQGYRRKENIVVFPHRLDTEKNPDTFRELKQEMERKFPLWKFILSSEKCSTKKEYYDLLNRSRLSISLADQETWGIAMQESVFCGCIPLVPNRLSYKEMYPLGLRYRGVESLKEKISHYIMDIPSCRRFLYSNSIKAYEQLSSRGENAIPNMINHINSF